MKIWIQIILHFDSEHKESAGEEERKRKKERERMGHSCSMFGCGLYNANDNDNQVNTTIWQETKNEKKRK